VEYTARSTRLEFIGWSTVEHFEGSALKTPVGGTPSVRFLVGEGTLGGAERMMITLGVGAERPLTGQVWLNGQRVADLTIRSREPEYYVIGVPRALVRTIEYDVLESNVLEWHGTPEREETPILLWALRVHAGRRRAY
jgi:hypothetical protein